MLVAAVQHSMEDIQPLVKTLICEADCTTLKSFSVTGHSVLANQGTIALRRPSGNLEIEKNHADSTFAVFDGPHNFVSSPNCICTKHVHLLSFFKNNPVASVLTCWEASNISINTTCSKHAIKNVPQKCVINSTSVVFESTSVSISSGPVVRVL